MRVGFRVGWGAVGVSGGVRLGFRVGCGWASARVRGASARVRVGFRPGRGCGWASAPGAIELRPRVWLGFRPDPGCGWASAPGAGAVGLPPGCGCGWAPARGSGAARRWQRAEPSPWVRLQLAHTGVAKGGASALGAAAVGGLPGGDRGRSPRLACGCSWGAPQRWRGLSPHLGCAAGGARVGGAGGGAPAMGPLRVVHVRAFFSPRPFPKPGLQPGVRLGSRPGAVRPEGGRGRSPRPRHVCGCGWVAHRVGRGRSPTLGAAAVRAHAGR